MQVDPSPIAPHENPDPTPTNRTPPAQQLSLVKPCAWPFPISVSHFADSAVMATLARDAALMESYAAQLAAFHLLQADHSTVCSALQQQTLPLAHALLPANMLHGALAKQSVSSRQELGMPHHAEVDARSLPQLRLMWHAAACFAELASESDRDMRSQWSQSLASQMKVTVLDSICCSSQPLANMSMKSQRSRCSTHASVHIEPGYQWIWLFACLIIGNKTTQTHSFTHQLVACDAMPTLKLILMTPFLHCLQEALSGLGPKLNTVVTAAQSVAEAVQQLVEHPVALQLLQAVQASQVGHMRSLITFGTVRHHSACLLLLAQCCLLCCLCLMRTRKSLLQCVASLW